MHIEMDPLRAVIYTSSALVEIMIVLLAHFAWDPLIISFTEIPYGPEGTIYDRLISYELLGIWHWAALT
jgi:hypothetical protein